MTKWPHTQADWNEYASEFRTDQAPCTIEDVACSYMEPHSHGLACDTLCHCRHTEVTC